MEAVAEDAAEFTDLLPGGLLKFPEVRDPTEAVAEDEQHHDKQAHLVK